MCTVCGCAHGETRIEGKAVDGHDHDHTHDHGHHHDHGHSHDHGAHTHDYGQGPAHAHAPGMSQSRMIQIETDIMSKNDEYAAANRKWLQQKGIFALNLVSSPGSGKTTLLTRSINDLKEELSISVIEGDQQTANDADRIRETGAPANSGQYRQGLSSGWSHGWPCHGKPEAGR